MDIFSNILFVNECLLDSRRTKAFKKAIENAVKSGNIVLDVGTGTGVMAMFAAKAGAQKVFAVEIDKEIAKLAEQNISHNNLSKKIEVLVGDMKELEFKNTVDTIIMEVMDTGLIAEQQAVIINRLQKIGVINNNTNLIPYRYQCAFELINYDFNFYGLKIPFIIQARNFSVKNKILQKLSKTIIYKDIDFHKYINTNVEAKVKVEVNKDGVLNAMVLKSRIFLNGVLAIWGTTDMNMPVIIPLNEKNVKKGDVIEVIIKYNMGEGFRTFSAKII